MKSVWKTNDATTLAGYSVHKIVGRRTWSFPEHGHDGFGELVCATAGSFRNTINGLEYTQEAGNVIFVRSSDVHSLAGSNFSYVNVIFQSDWLVRMEHFVQSPGLAESLLGAARPPQATIRPSDRAEYERALNRLLANSTSAYGRRLFARFLLMIVTQYLSPPAVPGLSSNLPAWLVETVSWISRNRERLPSLADIIRHSCRCHEHFTREFSRHMGMPPSLYLANLRIDRAAEMLVTTNYKTIDICHAAGFENESYFYRLFRERKKMTPRAWRQNYGPRSVRK